MIKELFEIGIGTALIAREKVEEELGKLEDKGKISKEEAAKFIASAKERSDAHRKELREELKSMIKEVIDEMGLATKEDIEALKK